MGRRLPGRRRQLAERLQGLDPGGSAQHRGDPATAGWRGADGNGPLRRLDSLPFSLDFHAPRAIIDACCAGSRRRWARVAVSEQSRSHLMDAGLSIRRRPHYWIGLVVGAVLVTAVLSWAAWRVQRDHTAINASRLPQVHVGMTEKEVEAAFAGPSRCEVGMARLTVDDEALHKQGKNLDTVALNKKSKRGSGKWSGLTATRVSSGCFHAASTGFRAAFSSPCSSTAPAVLRRSLLYQYGVIVTTYSTWSTTGWNRSAGSIRSAPMPCSRSHCMAFWE